MEGSAEAINFNAGPGIAVREYQTDVGPADYVLFIDQNAVGVIEAKPEKWGQNITTQACAPVRSRGFGRIDDVVVELLRRVLLVHILPLPPAF